MKQWDKKGLSFLTILFWIAGILLFIFIFLPVFNKNISTTSEKNACIGATGICKAECDIDETESPTNIAINTTGKLCPPKSNLSLTKCCIKT